MIGLLDITTGSPGCTVQDRGRFGHRHQGIPVSGWLDGPLAEAANALVGNAPTDACIELRGLGPALRIRQGPLRLALAGQVSGRISAADGQTRLLAPWASRTLQTGDRLQLGAVAGGCAYLALAGGISVALQLGSRSTYVRAGIGGLAGQALQAGDVLPCGQVIPNAQIERLAPQPWQPAEGTIRVMLGPQQDHFSAAEVERFLATPWQATAAQDRMGLRLQGQPLQHITPQAADITSDGVAPGAIQVPASGQPIVLLADGQTVGGYPKLATVISADLPRLAQARPGSVLHFAAVDAAGARLALLEMRQALQAWAAGLQTYLPTAGWDEAALLSCNLISGMVAGGD